jgi:uncharacterized protein (TIGR02453 family)
MGFEGFGAEASAFWRDLAANNDRSWFEENRGRYEGALLGPATAFVEELGPRLAKAYLGLEYGSQRNGTASIMRIHRDVRFAKDKSPYKTNLGLIFWIGRGKKVELPIFYFHLEAERAFFYGGWHLFPGAALARYREAVAEEARGKALAKLLARLAKEGLVQMEEPAWKRVPGGYGAEHPRAELLRLPGLGVGRDLGAAELAGADLPERCAALALRMRPLMDWLALLR